MALGAAAIAAKFGQYTERLTAGLIIEHPMRELTAIDAAQRQGIPSQEQEKEKVQALLAKYKLYAAQLLAACFSGALEKRGGATSRPTAAFAGDVLDIVVVHNGGLPRPILEMVLQFLFEEMHCARIAFLDQATLVSTTVLGRGESSLVLDVGSYASRAMPVLDGALSLDYMESVEVGGETATARMLELLEAFCRDSPKGAFQSASPDRREYVSRQAKHSVGFVSAENNLHHDMSHNVQKTFPWSTEIGAHAELDMREECFLCIEDVLKHVADCVVRVASSLPEESRSAILRRIIVTGGSAQLPGLQERLLKMVELQLHMLGVDEVDVRVDASQWTRGSFSGDVWDALEANMNLVTSEEYFSYEHEG
jgi:hypothetical protein